MKRQRLATTQVFCIGLVCLFLLSSFGEARIKKNHLRGHSNKNAKDSVKNVLAPSTTTTTKTKAPKQQPAAPSPTTLPSSSSPSLEALLDQLEHSADFKIAQATKDISVPFDPISGNPSSSSNDPWGDWTGKVRQFGKDAMKLTNFYQPVVNNKADYVPKDLSEMSPAAISSLSSSIPPLSTDAVNLPSSSSPSVPAISTETAPVLPSLPPVPGQIPWKMDHRISSSPRDQLDQESFLEQDLSRQKNRDKFPYYMGPPNPYYPVPYPPFAGGAFYPLYPPPVPYFPYAGPPGPAMPGGYGPYLPPGPGHFYPFGGDWIGVEQHDIVPVPEPSTTDKSGGTTTPAPKTQPKIT